ncbi:hypothetical protein JXE04_00675 [Patescibacteria group bacterium]|nr:hypothetical protein [Patescibacteria group bacterium]
MKKYIIILCIFIILASCNNNNSNTDAKDLELPVEYLALIEKLDSLYVQKRDKTSSDVEEAIKLIEKELLEKYPALLSKEEDAGKEGKE